MEYVVEIVAVFAGNERDFSKHGMRKNILYAASIPGTST